MSDAQVDAVAGLVIADEATFASLPLPLACLVFLALPPDARGRACCVCRAWRDALADPSLWSRLDMSFVPSDDDWQHFVSVLDSAAGRARCQLQQLTLLHAYGDHDDLLPVLTSNAGSLRELHLRSVDGVLSTTVQGLVSTAPLLQVLTVESVNCSWEDAPQVLRSEPPFALLQTRCILTVCFFNHDHDNGNDFLGGMQRFAPFAAALAEATLQPALVRLCVSYADVAQPALMGALADAALARRLPELRLEYCAPPAAAPLARLLAEGSLAALEICAYRTGIEQNVVPQFDAAGAALMADALRVNTTLTKLKLHNAGLCCDMMRVAGVLLVALLGHPSLRVLHITYEYTTTTTEDRSAFGAALGELIAGDAPALQELVCYRNSLGDAGLAPIVDALALNCHLRKLDVCWNDMSEKFARKRLLPAVVYANTTLCSLKCADYYDSESALDEAEDLVRLRGELS
jgi:hypothetical protein